MISKLRLAVVAAGVATAVCGQAVGADYDPPIFVDQPSAEEYVPVEVGSGWYLRGDIGYVINKPYDRFQEYDGFKLSDSPLSGSVGVGYHINSFLRAELDMGILPTQKFANSFMSRCETTLRVTHVEHRPLGENEQTTTDNRVSINCDAENAVSNKAYDGMAHLYADLGTFSGITPYVGAGLGLIYSTYRASRGDRFCREPAPTTVEGIGFTETTEFICDTNSAYRGSEESERQYGLAYALSAGVAWQVSANTALDFGYQYKGAPGLRYATSENDIVKIGEGTGYHTVKVGLRYDLW